jgi:S1-C subfamily serine protease
MNCLEAEDGPDIADIAEHVGQAVVSILSVQLIESPGTTPGDQINLTVLRDGKEQSLAVKVEAFLPVDWQTLTMQRELGFVVRDLTPEMRHRLRIYEDKGIIVTSIHGSSSAFISGLRSGAVIIQANGENVNSVEDFLKILERTPAEKGLLLLVRFDVSTQYVLVQP